MLERGCGGGSGSVASVLLPCDCQRAFGVEGVGGDGDKADEGGLQGSLS